jgi:hypothetical protein
MKTSVRDLLITGWLIIWVATAGVVAIHPSFQDEGFTSILRLAGLALIATVGGLVLTRYVEILGHSSAKSRKMALGLFVVSMLPLIPVALVTFTMPWAAMIILTLIYARWKWSLISSSN